MGTFKLSDAQERWASKPRRDCSSVERRELLSSQQGLCALSGAEMVFESQSQNMRGSGPGCHPLYPTIDHTAPGTKTHGLQIISHGLNEMKGQLPLGLFKVLLASEPWRNLMEAWRDQARKNSMDIEAFRRIVKDCI